MHFSRKIKLHKVSTFVIAFFARGGEGGKGEILSLTFFCVDIIFLWRRKEKINYI